MTSTNLTEVISLLEVALDRAEQVDGRDVPEAQHGKSRAQELSDIQKNLLNLAHLCDKARVLVLDQYHAVRGFTDHLNPGGQA